MQDGDHDGYTDTGNSKIKPGVRGGRLASKRWGSDLRASAVKFREYMEGLTRRDARLPRDKVRSTRMTADEADQLDRAAQRRNMNVNQYLRAAALYAIDHDINV